MAMTMVVMAAGVGSRFGGMKQLAGIGPAGETLFDYSVYDSIRAGFDRAVFVVSEQSRTAVVPHVEEGCGRHVEVRYAEQPPMGRQKPMGTGHALLSACSEVEGPFGVVNADDFYGRRSFQILAGALEDEHEDHVLVGFRLADTLSSNGGVSRARCLVEDGTLTGIRELHEVQQVDGSLSCREGEELTGDELVSANLWGFRPDFCRTLHEDFERFRADLGADPAAEFLIGDSVESVMKAGARAVRVVATPERFLGVTFREDVAGVASDIAALVDRGIYPTPLWADAPPSRQRRLDPARSG